MRQEASEVRRRRKSRSEYSAPAEEARKAEKAKIVEPETISDVTKDVEKEKTKTADQETIPEVIKAVEKKPTEPKEEAALQKVEVPKEPVAKEKGGRT